MTAVYHGRGEKMEGYELYRLSDEEIQHVGVKGMKWGKRKSRSAYMTAVDKHEAKTKANRQKVADHKAREKEQGKAVAKAVGKKYMGAVAKHEAKSKANNEKLAAHKAREKEAGKKAFKKGKEKAISALNNPKVNTTLNKAVNTATKLYVYNKSLEMFGMTPVPAIKTAGMVAANAIVRQYTNGRVY